MKKFIVVLCVLMSGVVNGQSLSNYYLEPGSTNQEVILHTSFYYHHGAGFIESNVEVVGNHINFSICYVLSSTTVVTNDDQEFIINVPNTGFPNYILNVNLYLWDQTLNTCDYSNVVDGGTINFESPYLPTDLVQVPDDNFEGFFEAKDLGDGLINNLVFRHRIENISRLDIYGYNLTVLGLERIKDLTGIEHLPRLNYLFGPDNLIEEYDATNNPALERLFLSFNPLLTSLDLSSCPNLWYLDADYTQLSSLDVSNNLNLSYLSFTDGNITELDLTQNVNLIDLTIYRTAISSLDLSNSQNLERLWLHQNDLTSVLLNSVSLKDVYFQQNPLTTIDLSMCPALESFHAALNTFTSLDFSQNPALNWLHLTLEDDLVSLDLRNGNNENLEELSIINLSGSLTCISVDNENLAPYPGWGVGQGPIVYSNDCALGIGDSEINNMQLYPNPVHSILNIQSQESIKSSLLYDIYSLF